MTRPNRCLAAFGAPLLALAIAGCDGGTTDPIIDVGPRSTMTAAESELARESCTYKSGTLPGLSLAKDAPLGEQIPIDTIVVLMMENRSFDHMLATLDKMQPDVDVAPLDATNLD